MDAANCWLCRHANRNADVDEIERVQMTATKLIPELSKNHIAID